MKIQGAWRRCLALAAGFMVFTAAITVPAQPCPPEGCGDRIPGTPPVTDLAYVTYAKPDLGFSVRYPSAVFTQVPAAVENDPFVRFRSADGLSGFLLSARPNEPRRGIDELVAEANAGFAEERADITYRRTTSNWFVLSGFIREMIFYRKTILTHDGSIIATLQINFPKDQKPFYYDIVEQMSWSFRPR